LHEPGTIRADRIWKRFRPDRTRNAMVEQLAFLRDRMGGKPIGWHWALRDVTLHARPGDAIGLLGNNGSGKSTLLKILTRVMYPHSGRVEAVGRVGALIEVRAGIHEDLSGRENVFLFGTLLGLGRKEVANRFDEIVHFAQLEDSIDRLVKFYSSGMQMRLGFAVAAFLEPDVLLVDEVLAVGDQAFQQRCLDRMRTVLGQGTTLVYVSHDLPTVEAVCNRGVWLARGVVAEDGDITEVIGSYRRSIEEAAEFPHLDDPVQMVKVQVAAGDGALARTQEPLTITAVVESERAERVNVFVGISEGTSQPAFVVMSNVDLAHGQTELRCHLPRLPLPHGRFFVWLGMEHGSRSVLSWRPVTSFDVFGPSLVKPPLAVVRPVPVHVEAEWEVGPR